MTQNKLILFFTLLSILVSCKQNKETIQQMVDKGVDLVNAKKYNEAIAIYSKAIQRNPGIQLTYYNRGIAFTELKDYSNAFTDFNKVIELQTVDGYIVTYNSDFYPTEETKGQIPYNDALYQRAIVKFHMDSLNSAFLDFQILIDNNYEEKSNCLLWQATLLGKSGNPDKACEYFVKAKENAVTAAASQEADEMIAKYCNRTESNP